VLLLSLASLAYADVYLRSAKILADRVGSVAGLADSEAILAAIQAAIKAGKFLGYQIAVIMSNGVLKAATGRGPSLVANASLTRIMGIFAGPIGWVLTGIWTIVDYSWAGSPGDDSRRGLCCVPSPQAEWQL
jgi:uncharacterized protein YaaW (UPF0174 family)